MSCIKAMIPSQLLELRLGQTEIWIFFRRFRDILSHLNHLFGLLELGIAGVAKLVTRMAILFEQF
jgi:hypothetical protein